jgi:ApaG protein
MSLPVTLYRALLRDARTLSQPLRVRLPVHLSPSQWLVPNQPQFQQLSAEAAAATSALQAVFPGIEHPAAQKDEIEPGELIELIRSEFRRPAATKATVARRLDDGIAVLREMNSQLALARCSSVARTTVGEDVCVQCEAHSLYRGRGGRIHAFQYRIRITNVGDSTVKLLGRQWVIRNSDGSLHAEVPKGTRGVVGEQPTLLPGEAFEYSSGTTVDTAGGSVCGSFQMERVEDQEAFDAAVDAFELIANIETR